MFFLFCFLRSIWSSCWLPWHHLAYFAHLSPSEAWSVETFPPGNGRKHLATHWGGGGEESTNWIDSAAWKKPLDDELDDWQLLAPGRESLLDLLAWLCLVYLQAICTWDFLIFFGLVDWVSPSGFQWGEVKELRFVITQTPSSHAFVSWSYII